LPPPRNPSYGDSRDDSYESDYSYDSTSYESYRSEPDSYDDRSYGQGPSFDQPAAPLDSPLDRAPPPVRRAAPVIRPARRAVRLPAGPAVAARPAVRAEPGPGTRPRAVIRA